MRIFSIGCGNMGAAILSGLARKVPDTAILAVDPDTETARRRLPESANAEVVATRAEAEGWNPDVILLAVKPQQFAAGTEAFPPEWQNALVISIMAGTPLAAISNITGGWRHVRVMPNLPALIGQAMSVGFAANGVDPDDRAIVSTIFSAIGLFSWVEEEDQIELGTAVSGSGPGYVFSFAEHLEAAARDAGIPSDLASKLVVQTLVGATTMLAEDSRSASELKEMVSSKGGTTLAGLSVLEAPGALPPLLKNTVRAALVRARQLRQA